MTRSLKMLGRRACLALIPWCTLAAAEALPPGQTADGSFAEPASQFNYLVGASIRNSPTYTGSAARHNSLSPLWSFSYGRFRISTGRANALMGFGAEAGETGATAMLLTAPNLRVSGSLRLDSGRRSVDDPRLAGLPDIRPTLLGRLGVGFTPAPGWSAGLGLSQDLLGRDSGAQMETSLTYTHPISSTTRWVGSASASFGSTTFMSHNFGVPAGTGSPLPTFNASAGFYNTQFSLDLTTAITDDWILFAGVSYSRLRGPARESPLTLKPDSYAASVGLVYRCCR